MTFQVLDRERSWCLLELDRHQLVQDAQLEPQLAEGAHERVAFRDGRKRLQPSVVPQLRGEAEDGRLEQEVQLGPCDQLCGLRHLGLGLGQAHESLCKLLGGVPAQAGPEHQSLGRALVRDRYGPLDGQLVILPGALGVQKVQEGRQGLLGVACFDHFHRYLLVGLPLWAHV